MSRRFALRYGWSRLLLTLLGLGPGRSAVDVDDVEVRVRMGWAFRAAIPRADARGAERRDIKAWMGIGVHGWGGEWLVNGSTQGVVTIEIDPPAPARVIGVVPVRLRRVHVSVTEPDALVTTLTG